MKVSNVDYKFQLNVKKRKRKTCFGWVGVRQKSFSSALHCNSGILVNLYVVGGKKKLFSFYRRVGQCPLQTYWHTYGNVSLNIQWQPFQMFTCEIYFRVGRWIPRWQEPWLQPTWPAVLSYIQYGPVQAPSFQPWPHLHDPFIYIPMIITSGIFWRLL